MNWLYQYFIGNIDNSIDYCKKSEKKNEIFQRRNDERFKVDNSYIYDGKEKIGHWIDDYDKLLDIANEQHETIQVLKASNGEMEDYLARLEEENEQLKKQIERIDFILDDLNGAEYISRDDGIKALNKIDKVIGKR